MFVGNEKKGWTHWSTSVHKISLQKKELFLYGFTSMYTLKLLLHCPQLKVLYKRYRGRAYCNVLQCRLGKIGCLFIHNLDAVKNKIANSLKLMGFPALWQIKEKQPFRVFLSKSNLNVATWFLLTKCYFNFL